MYAKIRPFLIRFFKDFSIPFTNMLKLVIISYFILQILLVFSFPELWEILVILLSPFCVFLWIHLSKWKYFLRRPWINFVASLLISSVGYISTIRGMHIVKTNLQELGFYVSATTGDLSLYSLLLFFSMTLLSLNTEWGKLPEDS